MADSCWFMKNFRGGFLTVTYYGLPGDSIQSTSVLGWRSQFIHPFGSQTQPRFRSQFEMSGGQFLLVSLFLARSLYISFPWIWDCSWFQAWLTPDLGSSRVHESLPNTGLFLAVIPWVWARKVLYIIDGVAGKPLLHGMKNRDARWVWLSMTQYDSVWLWLCMIPYFRR